MKFALTIGAAVPPDAAKRTGYIDASHVTWITSTHPSDGRAGSNLNGSWTVRVVVVPFVERKPSRFTADGPIWTTRAPGYSRPPDHTFSALWMSLSITIQLLSFTASPTRTRAVVS